MTNAMLSALVNGAILSVAATLAIALALRFASRSVLNAATRYGVWFTLLILSAALPAAFIPGPPARVEPPAAPPLGALPLQEYAQMPVLPAQAPVVSNAPFVDPAGDSSRAPADENKVRAVTWAQPLRVREGMWLKAALLLWLAATLFMAARLSIAYATLRRQGRLDEAPDRLASRVENWLAERKSRLKSLKIVLSSTADTPVAVGFVRPAIVLPANYPNQFSNEELEQICLHEAAHLVRRDHWTLLIQRVIQTLLPWHPAVLWIGRQLDLEREIACDDYVVDTTEASRAYASCLTRVAELGAAPATVLATLTVIGKKSDLERRIDSLLEKRRRFPAGLLKGRFAALALVLLGFALASGRMREMFALAQAGALLGLPPQAQEVADAASTLPPEFGTDLLLLLVERGHIVDPKHKRQAVEHAWDLAPKARYRNEITPAVYPMSTESGAAALDTSLKKGLTVAGLQLRVITQMNALDPLAARAMFGSMIQPEVESMTCLSDRRASHGPYFKALELVLSAFTKENAGTGGRTELWRNALRSLSNPEDLRLSLGLLQGDALLSDFEYVELLNQWSGKLAQSRFVDRVYSSGSLLRLSDPAIAAARQFRSRGGNPATLLLALRSYMVRHARAIRCEDGPGRTATTLPGEPRPANNEDTARLAFNAAIAELAPEIPPIRPEEITPLGTGDRANIIQYINWFSDGDTVPPDVARNIQLLQANKALRFGPELAKPELTVEERSTPEWNTQALQFLSQLENWSKDIGQSNVEAFFQKTFFYGNLLELVPDGRLRDTLLRSYVNYLATSPVQHESPPEWLRRVNEVIGFRDVRDRHEWINQIEAAGDRTISVYCKLARLSLDLGTLPTRR